MVPPNGESRALGVDVDPLVVAGRVGERVDLGLSDLVPAAHPHVVPRVGLQIVDAVDRKHPVLLADTWSHSVLFVGGAEMSVM